MVKNYDYPQEDIFRILKLLSQKENLTQRDLVTHLDFSLGKANYLLKSLVKKGLVKVSRFSQSDKKIRKVKYLLTKKGIEQRLKLTYYFLKKKEAEYTQLKKEWRVLKGDVKGYNKY
jgi:EPS-associated MarR family transcriptional regulator